MFWKFVKQNQVKRTIPNVSPEDRNRGNPFATERARLQRLKIRFSTLLSLRISRHTVSFRCNNERMRKSRISYVRQEKIIKIERMT